MSTNGEIDAIVTIDIARADGARRPRTTTDASRWEDPRPSDLVGQHLGQIEIFRKVRSAEDQKADPRIELAIEPVLADAEQEIVVAITVDISRTGILDFARSGEGRPRNYSGLTNVLESRSCREPHRSTAIDECRVQVMTAVRGVLLQEEILEAITIHVADEDRPLAEAEIPECLEIYHSRTRVPHVDDAWDIGAA